MKPVYKRMLKALAQKSSGEKEWSVYMLRCEGGSLYTGIAKDVEARLAAHRSGKGAAYTRTHAPLGLVYEQAGYTRSEALVREAAIKSLPKERKEALTRPPAPSARAGTRRPRGSRRSR
ncbi:MAG: GIY-YIG nuclease family protein [Elusimicrobiota bacterium]|jgi:putative endonuclease